MSKAILVMDTPSSCSECPCCYISRCEVSLKSLKTSEIYECKPDWCPLKLMPEKVEEHPKEHYEFGSIGLAFDIGYNACINKISGQLN